MKKPAPCTDLLRVKREVAADAPIDDQTGPYDPNVCEGSPASRSQGA